MFTFTETNEKVFNLKFQHKVLRFELPLLLERLGSLLFVYLLNSSIVVHKHSLKFLKNVQRGTGKLTDLILFLHIN